MLLPRLSIHWMVQIQNDYIIILFRVGGFYVFLFSYSFLSYLLMFSPLLLLYCFKASWNNYNLLNWYGCQIKETQGSLQLKTKTTPTINQVQKINYKCISLMIIRYFNPCLFKSQLLMGSNWLLNKCDLEGTNGDKEGRKMCLHLQLLVTFQTFKIHNFVMNHLKQFGDGERLQYNFS